MNGLGMNELGMIAAIADKMRVNEPRGCIAQLHINLEPGLGELYYHVEVGSPSGKGCGARNPDLRRAIRAVYRIYVLGMSYADDVACEPWLNDPCEHPIVPSEEQEEP